MDVPSLSQIGPYEVERFIDAGAFAWVFEVRDPKFEGRRLALKMLMPEAAEGPEFRRFKSEARLLAQIDHPNVVTIFDFGWDEATGNSYYVMTFVDGPTLKTRLKQGPMPIDEALPLCIDLLDGLARIHEKGIVHRDIKPANILLGRDGRARLADLGIARVQAERSETRTGVAVGTALYMSPEQARGREVDPRSDLFSMGLTLYECVTGEIIYDHVESIDSSSGMDVLMYIGSLVHTQREFDVRFDSDSSVPEALQRIILKSLRLNPDDRFSTAREMRDALRGVISGHPPHPPMPVPVRSSQSRTVLAVGGGVSAILILTGLYFFYWAPRQAAEESAARAAREVADVSVLAEAALAVASDMRDLHRVPETAVLGRVDQHVDRGDRYLEDGASDLEAGSVALALKNLERGRTQYLTACRLVVQDMLQDRVNGVASALRERALQLADRGAQDVVPDEWKVLAGVLPQTEGGVGQAAGCAAAQSEIGRLQAALRGAPLADAVAAALATTWPRVLDAAYEEAATARMIAVAVPSAAREYRVALKEAKRFLLVGSRHRRAGDSLAAQSAYRSAERGFEVAARIAPAAENREAARRLAQETISENGTEIGDIALSIESGELAYTEQRWEDAQAEFEQALADLKDLREATAWRRAAIAAGEAARAARTEALDTGAQASAPTEFAQAEASFSDAERGLESGDARRAELGYGAARDEFGAAKKRAIQALRDAGRKRVRVLGLGADLRGEGDCDVLEVDAGRSSCVRAEEALAAGDAAAELLDAPGALRNFSFALEAYARARSAQVLWEATRPRPPVLVRRVPQRKNIEASSRQVYSFGVEAHDPNGDRLSYRWTLDGELQADEQGPTMKRRLDRGAVISVTVDDGRGGELIEEWRVDVVEGPGGSGPSH